MRLRTTRTSAAPNQCTSLNGSTQYYSKTSPAGMTFTDDFTVSAWIKLTSYGTSSVIASRYNGTSGWRFTLNTTGQLTLEGYNAGAGNISYVSSYNSIPLNKWVHVAAQLDMSAFTATTITSYTMINGVDVPATVTRVGSNPTALIQAGDLNIGASNAGSFFPGKIAQVAIYSAKVTQATILASMNQTLSGSETSLVSAYSFSNTINDLNTTNVNNLTANGSAVATNADSPYGTQADGTISTTLDYCVVRSVTFSTNTTIVVQVADGCTIPTSGGVSAVAYTAHNGPYGFPSTPNILGIAKIANYVTSASAADVDVSGLTVTVYVPAGGHAVEIKIGMLVYSTAGGDSGQISLYEDGSSIDQFLRVADGNNYYDFIMFEFTRYPSAGTHTYKVMAQRAGGTGTMRFGGAAANQMGYITAKLAT
jgi:hypothetical protein